MQNTDHLEAAEENLAAEYERLEKQLSDVKKALADVRALRNAQGTQPTPRVRENEFKGLSAIKALEQYFRARRGLRIPLNQAVADILRGGADPGKPRGRQTDPFSLVAHVIKISLPNKTKIFDWEPKVSTKKGKVGAPSRSTPVDRITVWLAEGADLVKPRMRNVEIAKAEPKEGS